jgi:hypothetical protein
MAPRSQQASLAQKGVLLDTVIAVTGNARKYAITLLNQLSTATLPVRRSRQPTYGSQVQQALLLAWKATNLICAKRLIPFLPTLVPILEQHGHVHLNEQHRSHLLAMSVTTADRLLRTARTQVRKIPCCDYRNFTLSANSPQGWVAFCP